MDAKSIFPKLDKCPECSAKLKNIRYGMYATPPEYDEIDGGSLVDPNAPTKACPKCDWRGGNGGRTWETSWVETQTEIDNQGNELKVDREIDLTTMSVAELVELGETRLFPRFELVFLGSTAEAVDGLFDDLQAPSFPLIAKEVMFIHYNTETKLIEQASNFHAHRMNHHLEFLRPGFADWDSVIDRNDYQDAISKFSSPGLEIWELDLTLQYNADGEDGEWQHFGIPELKKMLASQPVELEELALHAKKFDRSIPLPYWFEPGLMFRENARIIRDLNS